MLFVSGWIGAIGAGVANTCCRYFCYLPLLLLLVVMMLLQWCQYQCCMVRFMIEFWVLEFESHWMKRMNKLAHNHTLALNVHEVRAHCVYTIWLAAINFAFIAVTHLYIYIYIAWVQYFAMRAMLCESNNSIFSSFWIPSSCLYAEYFFFFMSYGLNVFVCVLNLAIDCWTTA